MIRAVLLATWGGRATLSLQADQDPEVFRLCWQTSLPAAERLACGRFKRANAIVVGIYVSSHGNVYDANPRRLN